jgi:peptidoglycan/LPS O-acetylase OafA/YrhL
MPGWHAWVNGHAVQVSMTGEIFQQIALPKGLSDVRFSFRPPFMRLAYALFFAAAFLLCLPLKIFRFRPPWAGPAQASRNDVAGQPGQSRNGELEVLRTVAILMILLQHLPVNLMFWPSRFSAPLVDSGTWCGVDLFFAVSGFVIARGLLPQLQNVREAREFLNITVTFWIRRAWRLLPSAWFWLMAPLLLCVFFNRSGIYGSLRANWCMAVAGFGNLANFYLVAHFGQPGGVGTAFAQWSLSLEEQYYLALPFAAVIFRRYLPVLMGFLLLRAFYIAPWPLVNETRSGAFAAGVLLAMASRHSFYAACAPVFLAQSRLARILVLWGGIAFLVSFGDWSWRIIPCIFGPIAAAAGLLVWVASYGEGFLWRPGWPRRGMEIIAARSYSIYLVHIPVYFAANEAWFRLYKSAVPTHLQAMIYFAAAGLCLALVTELNHRLLERPLREHGKHVASGYARRMRDITLQTACQK